MGDYEDLIEQINAHCVGHPHAKIAWPHRLLHDCRDAIATLTRERDDAGVGACEGCGSTETIEAIRERHSKALSCCPERKMLSAKEWMARAEKAEADRDALRALLCEAQLAIQLLLNTPEISDCDPRDKDTETQIAERKARDLLARITAATQTETGGEDE